MVGPGPDPPPGVRPGSSDLGMLLHTSRGFIDGSITTFNESFEIKEPVFGTFGANTGRGNDTGEPVAADEDPNADTHDASDIDNGILFKSFKRLPLEIRSKIWLAAANAVMPCGVYHFTFKSLVMRPGPTYPDVCDTVLANLFRIPPSSPLSRSIHDLLLWSFHGLRIQTFTPSAAVATMTHGMRDLFRSCSEARAELMRSPRMSSSFEFHYLKGGKCNLGIIRPFLYDTDWISMDRPDHDPGSAVYINQRCTPDIKRIQHFAFPYDADWNPRDLFTRAGTTADGCRELAIFRWLDGVRSVGIYAPSFSIKRVAHWDSVIPQRDRFFLKCLPTPKPGPTPTLSWSAKDYRAAMNKLHNLVLLMSVLLRQKNPVGQPETNCDFTALQFCFIMGHADSRKGVDLTKFKEDGSHLDDVNLDDLETMGYYLKFLRREANRLKQLRP